jgi:hypothetical protein
VGDVVSLSKARKARARAGAAAQAASNCVRHGRTKAERLAAEAAAERAARALDDHQRDRE